MTDMPSSIYLVAFLTCIVLEISDCLQCQELDVSITQKVENEGFHKELSWLIEQSHDSLNCQLILMLEVGNGMFIDPYQIAQLTRTENLPMVIDGDVNIEVPAHLAREHFAYLFVPFAEKSYFNVPFHLRYQRAQISGNFGKVSLNKPSLLTNCSHICNSNKVEAPCDLLHQRTCIWNNVSYQALFDEVELLVPIGNLNDYPLVSVITLLLGCAGCIYTLSILSTTSL